MVLGERSLSWESVGSPAREVLSWKRGVCPGREGLCWVSGGSPGRERVDLRERVLSLVSGVVLKGSVCPGREGWYWERVVVLGESVYP